jgi:hypothetical protein
MEASTFDLVAASLRADARDMHAFVEALAEKLSLAVPAHVRVERGRSFGKRMKPLRRLTVDFPEERFELDATGGSPATTRSAVVRGIALRTEPLPLKTWIDELARAVAREAEQTEQGRAALERLLL